MEEQEEQRRRNEGGGTKVDELPMTQDNELRQGDVWGHFHRGLPIVPRILKVRHCVAKALNLHLNQ